MVPKGWILSTFEKHIDLLSGCAFKSAGYTENDEDVRLLRGDNIVPNSLRWRNAKRWPASELHKYERYKLQEHDFVIAMDRTWVSSGVKVSEISISDLPCLLVQRVSRIRALDTLDQSLLKQYFSGHRFEQYVKSVQTETAVPHISAQQIKEFSFLLPPLSEQRKIAKILSTWDKAIAITEKLIETNKQQKKALMQQLLTGKKRLAGFEQGWRYQPIKDISTRIQRKSDGQEHPVLTISSLAGFVTQAEKYSRYMAGKSVKNYILLKGGEFAYNKGNSKTYQFGCVFDLETFDSGLVPHVYVCFKLKEGLSHRYFKYLFEADYLKPQLAGLVNTGVRNNGLLNIKPAEFLNTVVPVPSYQEQVRIADVLHASSLELKKLEAKLKLLKEEKKALMQQLLTGNRRVKVADEQAT
ncbi:MULTISPECIES: restriction endonuclease subunit S [unclassified Endozoicomonas]|uniref:restriction endonuclease subunit S n=1 Tax=unclassified Endozoicomonas TaxID=2644528 RepID=UPI003BB571FF